MAADLLAEDAVFRQWLNIADSLVRERHGFSPLAETYAPERRLGDPFARLACTHPAIFATQYALAKVLQHHAVRPQALLGVSLGEFVAMTVAGMTPFEATLHAVADQPARFAETCAPGGMIAVLAPPTLHRQVALLADRTEIAGINAAQHFVLACPAEELAAVEAELKRREIVFQRLPVPFAFHSRWIEPAGPACRAAFARQGAEAPFWPVWSSCTGAPTLPEAPDLAWRIVREPMRVRATVEALEARGGAFYLDLSPSGTLAALIRQSLPRASRSRVAAILSPFGGNLKRLQSVLDDLKALAAD